MERAVQLAGDQTTLTLSLLPPEWQPRSSPMGAATGPLAPSSLENWLGVGDWAHCSRLLKQHGSLDELLLLIEWQIASRAMAAHDGNKSRAAKALGRSYRWLRKLESRLHPISPAIEPNEPPPPSTT